MTSSRLTAPHYVILITENVEKWKRDLNKNYFSGQLFIYLYKTTGTNVNEKRHRKSARACLLCVSICLFLCGDVSKNFWLALMSVQIVNGAVGGLSIALSDVPVVALNSLELTLSTR